jgi:hypothetical protein
MISEFTTTTPVIYIEDYVERFIIVPIRRYFKFSYALHTLDIFTTLAF